MPRLLTGPDPRSIDNRVSYLEKLVKSHLGVQLGIPTAQIPHKFNPADILTTLTTLGDLLYRDSAGLQRLPIGAADRVLNVAGGIPTWTALSSIDHGSLGGLADDDHTQYALLLGRATPQTIAFGTAASATAGYLTSTSHATKGNYSLNAAGTVVFNELIGCLGFGITPTAAEQKIIIDSALDELTTIRVRNTSATAGTGIGALFSAGSDSGSMTMRMNNSASTRVLAGRTLADWAELTYQNASGFIMGGAAEAPIFQHQGGRIRDLIEVSENLADNVAETVLTIPLTTLTAAGLTVFYTIEAADATDIQCERGIVNISAVNKGGVYTSLVTIVSSSPALSAGTLGVGWAITTGTNEVYLQVTANTSLTPTTLRLWAHYFNDSNRVITFP